MNRKNQIIIRVDGGICSQIAFVSLGLWLKERHPGLIVKYDLSWFRDCGMDIDGRFVRNWDFPKAFPDVEATKAGDEECAHYLKRYASRESDVEKYVPPLYVGGYPYVEAVEYAMVPKLADAFRPTLDDVTRSVLQDIRSGRSCAIHVRRGDLSQAHPVHGAPASFDYFSKAVRIISALDSGVRFFLFSDEPDWVRGNLVDRLPTGREYMVVEGHGSDKGYLDLYLISRCDHVISSAGSLGVFGALLSKSCQTLVVNRNREEAFRQMKNVIYLNDAYHVFAPPAGRKGPWARLCRVLTRAGGR